MSGRRLLLCNEPVTSDEHTAGNNGPANWLYRLYGSSKSFGEVAISYMPLSIVESNSRKQREKKRLTSPSCVSKLKIITTDPVSFSVLHSNENDKH